MAKAPEPQGGTKRIFKKPELIIAGILGVIILGIWGSAFFKLQESTNQEGELPEASQDVAAHKGDSIEEKLGRTLSAINGAGQVEVMITYESGPEIVPAVNEDRQTTESTEEVTGGGQRSNETVNQSQQTVTIQKGTGMEALILKELSPAVLGVVIVAEGAGHIGVRMDLMRAAQVALNVPLERIEVFEMKRSEVDYEFNQ